MVELARHGVLEFVIIAAVEWCACMVRLVDVDTLANECGAAAERRHAAACNDVVLVTAC